MPEKYHIHTQPVPNRGPRIGKHGVVDWREDCSRCHNCVKKACVYDRYRHEQEYIRDLGDLDALFFDCQGCFSCVQDCTKGLLNLSINAEYERLGSRYWTPEIIRTTWFQAETGQIPVSGAGYNGPFSGPGFDSMWTDMSEIVRPTRDGIHGREYINTSVDIGRKPSYLHFAENRPDEELPPIVSIQLPIVFDVTPPKFGLPRLDGIKAAAAARTDLISLIEPSDYSDNLGSYLPHLAFCLRPDAPQPPKDILEKTRLIELLDGEDIADRVNRLKTIHPGIVVCIRVNLDANGVERTIQLAQEGIEVVHVVADINGNEFGAQRPRFMKDMIRLIHVSLVDSGIRDQVTLIAGGGIALAEHMAKAIICGADLVSVDLPLLIALECRLCAQCKPGLSCPARLEDIPFDYGVGRMTNLMGAWHGQLIEVMGAMGMRELRRLRGDTGRAMFFEELEEEIFGGLFGAKKDA